ncbi:non-ribosomal peptide synthetase, partial [Francisella philomiragia]|uniref:non-ribosomal peptide synthetase n=1 Tax=Francisella philomiragia TaxID=28110 RepID=UPI001C9D709D
MNKKLIEDDYQRIVYDWNKTDNDYPRDKTVYELFEEQVLKNPDAIAIVFEDQEVTYKELNERSNQLARYIRKQYRRATNQELKPDTLIPLCLERGIDMVIGILGVMKSGGAYVPMDPDYPADRLKHILSDTNAKLVITQNHIEYRFKEVTDILLISINEQNSQTVYQGEKATNLSQYSQATDLAYVIYTSGTTGLPKGVMIEHHSVINLVKEQIYFFNLDKFSKVLQFASFVFDASVSEIFITLISGSTLYICSKELRKDGNELITFLMSNQISVAKFTPSFLSSLKYSNILSLKTLAVAGEIPNDIIVQKWSKGRTLLNVYGPTEGTVCSTMHRYVRGDISSNIGKSFNNIKLYVLDEYRYPVPLGVVGELYIGGAGLARGYLNRDDLTAERFVSNPFATELDIANGYTRLYKTGDLVRWLPDGNLEYIGRNDFQVKIRGYRIELGEIESQLLKIEGINQVAVLAKENEETKSKYLVGYYVPQELGKFKQESLLEELSNVLPEYMLPSILVELESFPLTINGKLDRKALPDPEFTNDNNYRAPISDLEVKMCRIWEEVLGLDRVGVTDNFFRIGGNSILAIKLSHRLSKEFDSRISVADVFKYKIIAKLLKYLRNNAIGKIVISNVKLNKYLLSFAQERLWFIEQYEQGTNIYHLPYLLRVLDSTDLDSLKKSIFSIVERHQILRSIFIQGEDGSYYQKVLNNEVDIKEYSYRDTDISKRIDIDINMPFDLVNDYPVRICFYHDREAIKLLINIHHIAGDGWSIDILFKELNEFYEYHLGRTEKVNLPELSIQYKDFAYWQREYLEGDILEKQLDYWKGRLLGYETLNLPTDYSRPNKINYEGDYVRFELDIELSTKLRQFAKDQHCSLYSVMLSAFYILLHKYTGQEDIVIGTPIANRHYNQLQDLIGFFVNSLALRELINFEDSVTELVQRVHNNLIEAQAHQDIPFENLVELLNVERDQSRHPIFQIMFGVQSFGLNSNNNLFEVLDYSGLNYKTSKFDIECFIDDSEEFLRGTINYATALYSRDSIQRMAEAYQRILNQLVESQEAKIKDYRLLSKEDYQKIVYAWNETDKEYPKDKTIYQLFEEQVEQNPNNIALVFEAQEMTYGELNSKSNQLARYIRKQYKEVTNEELKPDTLILLCLERSLDMVIAILAVMKSGGAYVPMDPDYPDERFKHILTDTDAELVITQSHLEGKLTEVITELGKDIGVISITPSIVEFEEAVYVYDQEDKSNLKPQSKSTDLAYVIYTSGTTGLPKGAVITHRLLVNRLLWQKEKYNFNNKDKVLQKTPYVFDVSVWELLLPLISLSQLHIAKPEGHKDPAYLYELINSNKITKLHFVPSMLASFISYLKEQDEIKLESLKEVLTSGEALSVNLAHEFKKLLPNVGLNNLYGPTEVAIDVTSYDDIQLSDEIIPIGRPIDNIRTYVLDKNMQPVPVGVIGELYLGAIDLHRGYLNRPELTAERFVANPFATESDTANGYTRLYRTGDLVRWLPDGNIEYIGRNDFQVKIRGYRIELGEIESQLSKLDGIKQSIVLAKEKAETKSQYLVGYYVADELGILKQEELLDQLSEVLPEYMVPSVLVELDSMPLTVNGKLDRKALPDPEFANEDEFVAPATELETKICSIWSEVLGLERVGVTDNFFRIGGDSIVSIQLSSKLRRNGIDCSVRDIFDYRTVSKLAKYLISKEEIESKVIQEQGVLEGEIGLLPIQEWFFDRVTIGEFKAYNHWNQSFLVKVPELDVSKISVIVEKLLSYHDILRANYVKQDDSYIQVYRSSIDIPELRLLDVSKLSAKAISKELTNWQSDFDIEHGPLWSIGYLHGFKDGSARIYFALHHLIVDAVSWRILIEDFKSLYNNEELSAKGTSYRQYIDLVKDYADNHKDQLGYWSNVLTNIPSYPEISSKPSLGEVRLNKAQTESLLQNGNKAYHTEINDLLLTALALSLKDINQSDVQAITLEGHGREYIEEGVELNHTIGWFTTMYPALLEIKEDLGSTIKYIKESLRAIPDKGIGFGSFAQSSDEIDFKQLPRISFNYLGQFDGREGLWQLVSESSGISMHSDNRDHNVININGMIVDGQLSFSVVTQLGKKLTDKLTKSFQESLIQIQEHTQSLIDQGEEYYTPSDYGSSISIDLLTKLEAQAKQLNSKIESIYPANSLQQGFIYHVLSNPNDDAYRVQLLFDYKQDLNVGNYVKAWELAIQKYPIFRTAFNWEEDLIQVSFNKGQLNYIYHDISDKYNKDQLIQKIQEQDRQQRFDLSKPTQLRLHIVKQTSNHYTIIKSNHHIISDGWSGPILFNLVHEHYKELCQGKQINVIEDDSYLRAQDYIQANQLKVKVYWDNQLQEVTTNDLNPLLSSKHDLNDVKSLDSYYDKALSIKGELYRRLKGLTKELGITTNTLVQFVWHKLIQIYTQDSQTIVGTTISGRDIPIEGIEDSVGLYINTLPLVIDWDNDNTVKEQLEYIHKQITDLSNNSYVSLSQLQDQGQRLFHSLFVFENYPVPDSNQQEDEYRLLPELRYAAEKLDYPIGVTVYEHSNQLNISIKSTEDLLSKSKAQIHLNKLELLLEQTIGKLNDEHRDLSILTDQERNQTFYDWNKTDNDYPRDKTVYELFEEQVLKNPDAIAIVFEDQ